MALQMQPRGNPSGGNLILSYPFDQGCLAGFKLGDRQAGVLWSDVI